MIDTADTARRFSGLSRLYGAQRYQRLRGLRLAVVGLGGVGSWAVEALARSGVAELTLIDMDVVAESNIHRQVQALGSTVGMDKGRALKERIADIHPECLVHVVDEFVSPENWPALLPAAVDGVIDACDHKAAKLAVACWGVQTGVPVVCSGAMGGKTQPAMIEVADLSAVTHDRLLASLRQQWRKHHSGSKSGLMGLTCVFSKEASTPPLDEACELPVTGSLNCHGYGSCVTVTATCGMVCAATLIQNCLRLPRKTC